MNSVDNPYFLVEGTDQRRSIEELKDHLASMVGLWAKSDSEKQLLLGRIEELEKACAEWAEVSQSNYQRAKAAEAKLAKAVEALGRIKRGDFSIMTPPAYVTNPPPSAPEIARTTLAELKGQNDE